MRSFLLALAVASTIAAAADQAGSRAAAQDAAARTQPEPNQDGDVRIYPPSMYTNTTVRATAAAAAAAGDGDGDGDGEGDVGGALRSIAEGAVHWEHINRTASFVVLPELVSPADARQIIELLQGVPFDADPESVDGEPTHEFWLEEGGSIDKLVKTKPSSSSSSSPTPT